MHRMPTACLLACLLGCGRGEAPAPAPASVPAPAPPPQADTPENAEAAALRQLGDSRSEARSRALMFLMKTRGHDHPSILESIRKDPTLLPLAQGKSGYRLRLEDGAPLALAGLKHPDAAVRRSAVALLWSGTWGMDRLTPEPPLAENLSAIVALAPSVLRDPDPDQRRLFAGALEALGSRAQVPIGPAAPALIEALKDTDPDVRRSAEAALALTGPEKVPALIAALPDAPPAMRVVLVRSVGRLGRPAPGVVDLAFRALRDPDGEVQKAGAEILYGAARALADAPVTIGAEEAAALRARHAGDLEAMVRGMKDPEVPVRLASISLATVFHPPLPGEVEAVRAALRDKDSMIRVQAAQLFARMVEVPNAERVRLLAPGLDDENPLVREASTFMIRWIEPDPATAKAVYWPALKHRYPDVRRWAADCVRSMRLTVEDLPALIDAAENSDSAMRIDLLGGALNLVLQHRGATAPFKAAVPRLLPLMKNEDLQVRNAVMAIFQGMGSAASEAIPALGEAVKDRDPGTRGKAAHALGAVGGESAVAVAALCEALRDPDANVRQHAIGGFNLLREVPTEAVPALAQALKDPDPSLRNWAAILLGKMGSRAAAARSDLLDATKDLDRNVRLHSSQTLAALGPGEQSAAPGLVKQLDDPDPGVRITAVRSLVKLAETDRAAASALANALSSPDDSVRSEASTSKKVRMTKEAVPALVKALQGPPGPAVRAALRFLEDLGPDAAAAVPQVAACLRHPGSGVRSGARAVLCKIGPAADDALPMLIEALKDDNAQVRGEAVRFLGTYGPKAAAAVPALEELLKKEPGLEASVKDALSQIRK